MTSFKEKVYQTVRLIPKGYVTSYGQIATMVGVPRAARQVGWVLGQIKNEEIPWWRVINNKGYISIKNPSHAAAEQKMLLEKENIKVKSDFTLDISKYRYRPNPKDIEHLELDQESLEKLFKIL